MPTKDRKARELERANEKARQKAPFEKIPVHIDQRILSRKKSTILLCDHIPRYLDLKGGLLTWDNEGTAWVSANIGKGANQERHEQRKTTAEMLKSQYLSIWGKRGTAKIININENISVRTVQQYYKDYP